MSCVQIDFIRKKSENEDDCKIMSLVLTIYDALTIYSNNNLLALCFKSYGLNKVLVI